MSCSQCNDIIEPCPIKVPKLTPNSSEARKHHRQLIEDERENFFQSPPSDVAIEVFDPDIKRSPLGRQKETPTIGKELSLRLSGGNNGVYLTWTNLCVSVPEKKRSGGGGGGQRTILEGLTGYVQPGEVLAIMGPSGSGKSTLLDALAGRLEMNTRQTGDILINGRKQRLAYGTSAYVTQDDVLMTTLTVKEAIYYSARLQLPDSMSNSDKIERVEATIKDMGLLDAMNTRIGGWNEKGISGGQKRRVSICLEILTGPKLLFLDEPTSGLDSATSYHVMYRIIKIAQRDRRTIIASIHQPSSEVFELFNNLCLLSSGRTVYFGSTSGASEFFSINGFPCPSRRNPSDHFLRTINKDFDSETEDGTEKRTSTLRVINNLVHSYKSSEAFQQVQQKIIEICRYKGETLRKGKQASFITQCLVLTKRSFVNMSRDLGYYWFRLAIYTALGFCIGTLYYDIGHSYGSIQARGSMLMFISGFLTFMAIGGFPSFVEDMKIFGRERLNGHYGVAAFVVGNTFSSIPFLLMIAIIPGVTAYYLVGLHSGIHHFIYFALLLFTSLMLVESLMMIVASIVPDFLMGIIAGAGIQGLMLLNGGFFRLPNDLPKPFWKYPLYYIAFHKYANQGFYKNEFEGLSFPNPNTGGSPTITGDEILRSIWQMEMGYSKWVDVGILFGMIILYRLIFFAVIKSIEKVKPKIQALVAKPPKLRLRRSSTTSTRARIRNGAIVSLKSISNLDHVVAIGIISSTNPTTQVGGVELGRNWCEVQVRVAVDWDEELIRPYGLFTTIRDTIGAPIAWPLSLVAPLDFENS